MKKEGSPGSMGVGRVILSLRNTAKEGKWGERDYIRQNTVGS